MMDGSLRGLKMSLFFIFAELTLWSKQIDMKYVIIEINNKASQKEFLTLPIRLYKNNPNWIRPLDIDVENVFNPKTNKHFRNGEAIRWILKNSSGETVGRVAAFVDYSAIKSNAQPTGGMGFFECIHCQTAADMLFDACRNWLMAKGIEAMDGPINFGTREHWWGLLIKGEYEPNYCTVYSLLYYPELFEHYGFKEYFQQLTYHMPVSADRIEPVVWEKAKRIAQNPEYRVECISRKNLLKYADDFVAIFNRAWEKFAGVTKMSRTHALALLKTIKPILDERLIIFAYHLNDPIGMLVMVPDLNQVVKHLNGKLNFWGKLRLLYLLRVKKVCKRALGLIYGVIPQYQGKGIDGALIAHFASYALKDDYPYREIEMNWIGDFNPTMQKLVEQIGAEVRKVHVTYRYMFDPNRVVTPPDRVS